MLERAYKPPRRGFRRVLDVRDWFSREVHRTYHKRFVTRLLLVLFGVGGLAVMVFAGHAKADPADTPDASYEYAFCSTLDKFGVSDDSMFTMAREMYFHYGLSKPRIRSILVTALGEVCPRHQAAVAEWNAAPVGTYSPHQVFTGNGGVPTTIAPKGVLA